MSRSLLMFSTLVLVCMCLSLSQSSPVGCCTKYSLQSLPLQRLIDYKLQHATMSCNIEAVIFLTVKGRRICANPSDTWVQTAMSHIQEKKARII